MTGIEFNRKAVKQGATSRSTGNYEWRTCPLPKVPMWRLELGSNLRPNLPLSP